MLRARLRMSRSVVALRPLRGSGAVEGAAVQSAED